MFKFLSYLKLSRNLRNYSFSYNTGNHFKIFGTKIKKINTRAVQLHSLSSKKVNITLHRNNKINYKYNSSNCLSNRIVGYWLLTCAGMVFVAVILGGVTRLTESGLSMVTWKLLGEKIPFDEISWLNEFEKYKKFPEFKIINRNMTLDEFKQIWWMEYAHRMWGRFIGIIFFLPAFYFWNQKKLSFNTKKKILLLGILIACQGLMGWHMVKSGLENDFSDPDNIPRVSQYRLAAHLGLAFVIYSGFLYAALDHYNPVKSNSMNYFASKLFTENLSQLKKLTLVANISKGLIFLTAISGAFVAGLDAGLIYNTFPKMSNKWIPDDILSMKPMIKNFTENATTVQFNHRILALLTLSSATSIGLMSYKYKLSKRLLTASVAVVSTAYLQATLGICALINYVPTYLGVFHQSGSLLLLSAIVWLCHETKYIKKLLK